MKLKAKKLLSFVLSLCACAPLKATAARFCVPNLDEPQKPGYVYFAYPCIELNGEELQRLNNEGEEIEARSYKDGVEEIFTITNMGKLSDEFLESTPECELVLSLSLREPSFRVALNGLPYGSEDSEAVNSWICISVCSSATGKTRDFKVPEYII